MAHSIASEISLKAIFTNVFSLFVIKYLIASSGPFPKYDAERGIYVHVFTARPIPTGMTVIATPLRENIQ